MIAHDIDKNNRLRSITRHLTEASDSGLGVQDLVGRQDDDMVSPSGRKRTTGARSMASRIRMMQRDLNELIVLGYVDPVGKGPSRRYFRTDLPIEAEVDALVMDKLSLLQARRDEQNKPINMLPLLRDLLKPQGSITGECLRIEPDSFQLIPAPIRESFLKEVVVALREGQKIQLGYLDRNGNNSQSELTPLCLKIKGAGLYLLARKQSGEERNYALQRFVSIQRLNQLIEDVPEPRTSPEPSVMMQVRMKISLSMASTLLDCKISPDQRITPLEADDSMSALLEASVSDEPRFLRWILSWCNDIEVLEPSTLREKVQSKLQMALQRYQSIPEYNHATTD